MSRRRIKRRRVGPPVDEYTSRVFDSITICQLCGRSQPKVFGTFEITEDQFNDLRATWREALFDPDVTAGGSYHVAYGMCADCFDPPHSDVAIERMLFARRS